MQIIDTFCQLCTLLFLKNIICKLYDKYSDEMSDKIMELYTSNPILSKTIFTIVTKSLYAYSTCQILYTTKIKPTLNWSIIILFDLLEKHKLINPRVKYTIEMYNNNILTNQSNITDETILFEEISIFKKQSENENITERNHLIVITDYSTLLYNQPPNKICYTKMDTINKFNYETSSVKFLYISLICNNMTYIIDLSTNQFHFYINGNIIDKVFILYYLKYILNVDDSNINGLTIDNIIYSITLCDQNANFITITNDDIIVIEKDNYKIQNVTKPSQMKDKENIEEEPVEEEKEEETLNNKDNDETEFVIT
jgi:hypothetical protein